MAYVVNGGRKSITIKSKKKAPNRSQSKTGTVQRKHSRTTTAKHGAGHPTQSAAPFVPARDPDQDQIDALVRLRYGGQDLALAQQQNNINAWFPQLQQQLAMSKAQSDAYYAGQQAANQQAALEAAKGPDLGPGVSADIQAQSKLAGASRQSMVGQFGQALGAAGAANGTFLQNQQNVAGAAQLQALLANQQARTQLASDKGQYAVQAKQDIADARQKSALENAAFGLDQQKAQNQVDIANQNSRDKAAQRRATSRNQAAQRKATARNEAANRKNARLVAGAKQRAADQAAKSKASKAHREKSNKALDRLNSISNDTHRWTTDEHTMNYTVEVQAKDKDGKPIYNSDGTPKMTKVAKHRRASREEAINRLRSEGFSADEIHLALKDEWDSNDVKLAHRLGIIVGDSGRKRAKKVPRIGSDGRPSANRGPLQGQ